MGLDGGSYSNERWNLPKLMQTEQPDECDQDSTTPSIFAWLHEGIGYGAHHKGDYDDDLRGPFQLSLPNLSIGRLMVLAARPGFQLSAYFTPES